MHPPLRSRPIAWIRNPTTMTDAEVLAELDNLERDGARFHELDHVAYRRGLLAGDDLATHLARCPMNHHPKFRVARNERTSLYELHTDPCRHLVRLDEAATVAGDTAVETATAFEAANDGIVVTLAPCAKRSRG